MLGIQVVNVVASSFYQTQVSLVNYSLRSSLGHTVTIRCYLEAPYFYFYFLNILNIKKQACRINWIFCALDWC